MQTVYINRNNEMQNIVQFMNDVVETMSLKSDNPSPFRNMVRRIYFDFKFCVCKKGAVFGSDQLYTYTHLDETIYSNVKEYSFELDMVGALNGPRQPGDVLQDVLTSFCNEAYPNVGSDEQVTLIGFTPRLKKTIFAIPEEYKDKMMTILSWFKSTIERLLDRNHLIPTVQSYDGQKVEDEPVSQPEVPVEEPTVSESPVEPKVIETPAPAEISPTEASEPAPSVDDVPVETEVPNEVVEAAVPEEIAHNLDDDFIGGEASHEAIEAPGEPSEEPSEAAKEVSSDVESEPVEKPGEEVSPETTEETLVEAKEEPAEVTVEPVEEPVEKTPSNEDVAKESVTEVETEASPESPGEEKVTSVPEETSPEAPHEEISGTPVKEEAPEPEGHVPEVDGHETPAKDESVVAPEDDVVEASGEKEVTDSPAEEDAKETEGDSEPVNDVVDFPFEGGTAPTKDLPGSGIGLPTDANDYPLRQYARGVRKTYFSEGGLVIPLDRVVLTKLDKDKDIVQVYLEHDIDILLKDGNAIDFLNKYREYMEYY